MKHLYLNLSIIILIVSVGQTSTQENWWELDSLLGNLVTQEEKDCHLNSDLRLKCFDAEDINIKDLYKGPLEKARLFKIIIGIDPLVLCKKPIKELFIRALECITTNVTECLNPKDNNPFYFRPARMKDAVEFWCDKSTPFDYSCLKSSLMSSKTFWGTEKMMLCLYYYNLNITVQETQLCAVTRTYGTCYRESLSSECDCSTQIMAEKLVKEKFYPDFCPTLEPVLSCTNNTSFARPTTDPTARVVAAGLLLFTTLERFI